MKIELTVRRVGDKVEVLQGERTTGQLCMGEVIEQVIRLIYADDAPRPPYPMYTPQEWTRRYWQRHQESTTAPEGNPQ